MKPISESFCTACEWHGDGEGITGCPICGEVITTLDSTTAAPSEDPEEYPEEMLKEASDDNLADEDI